MTLRQYAVIVLLGLIGAGALVAVVLAEANSQGAFSAGSEQGALLVLVLVAFLGLAVIFFAVVGLGVLVLRALAARHPRKLPED
jgi:hypothetical protein